MYLSAKKELQPKEYIFKVQLARPSGSKVPSMRWKTLAKVAIDLSAHCSAMTNAMQEQRLNLKLL